MSAMSLYLAMLMLCASLLLTACATPPRLVPAPGAERVAPGGTIAVSSAEGVTMTVDPDGWRGNVRIDNAVTPIHVKIENKSGRKLLIRYSDYAMVAADGERYAALPPYEVRGSVADPTLARRYPPVDPLGFTYDGFYVAPFYRLMYPSLSVYDAHAFHMDPRYYDRYSYWARTTVELPTAEMLRFALPEGVLDEGGLLAGFIYFEKVDSELQPPEVAFQANIVDITSQEKMATLEVPFVIETEKESSASN
jgi:hypothetical protein